MTMHRYALIDVYSRFVWGAVRATTPSAAAKKLDREIGTPRPRRYETISPACAYNRGLDGRSGYLVYVVPAELAIDDGQDQATIDRVSACRLAGGVCYTETMD